MRRFSYLRAFFTLLLSTPLALLVTGMVLYCQPVDPADTLALFLEKPIRILLNILPVWLLILSAASILNNLFYGAAAVNLPLCVLSIANRIKIQVRDEPVFPRDLALLKEVGSALGNYEIPFPYGLLAAALLFTLILALAGHLIDTFSPHQGGGNRGRGGTGQGDSRSQRAEWGDRRNQHKRRRSRKKKRLWLARLAGSMGSMAILVVLTVTVFSSDDLYNDLGASSPYRLSVVFNENGFLYNFFHQFTTYQVDRPAGYSQSRAAAWDTETSGQNTETGQNSATGENTGSGQNALDGGKPVHVILIMDEAFSDITDDPAFAFSEENDPLPVLHALRTDPHALSLRLVVPGFAGGTANTEFDVLTGMQTNALGAGTTSAMRTVNRNLDSLFRIFDAAGYHTSFFHPGDRWFYNRENVYRWFGAEQTLFIEQMHEPEYPEPEYKGRWVTDNYLAGLIEDEFVRTIEDGRLLFHYTTTIQNHMGYPYSKYGEGYEYPPVILAADRDSAVSDTDSGAANMDGGADTAKYADSIDAETRQILEVYTEGVRDADAMLGRLRDFFSARQEPVLLVFYGDHLPYLGENRHCYAALDMDIAKEDDARENWFSIYETPCVIWANDAAAEALDWNASVNALDLPDSGRISAAFLGSLLLELTGRGKITSWTAFLNDLRRMAPVIQGEVWMLADGRTVRANDADPVAAQIRKWRQWSYYRLEQKNIAS